MKNSFLQEHRFLFSPVTEILSAMPYNYVNQFPIENFSLNTLQLTFLVVGLVEFVLLNFLIDTKWVYSFFSGFRSSVKSPLISSNVSEDQAGEKDRDFNQEKRVDTSVSRGDIDIVLRSLGMLADSDETRPLPESLDAGDLLNMFEEENPSLDEVKEAFDVFDDNRDGFIDEKELQKVLCHLGLKEGLEMENCRRMIRMFDENGDGRIDFEEFVKFMEANFY